MLGSAPVDFDDDATVAGTELVCLVHQPTQPRDWLNGT
ncbi:hypothetical protein PC116_g22709 [Phytophthora cactorum]|uniref:Uncharacterized protein n=1 Tax=Phytophthora cactorum TaxID=29920 RepID=A0A8T1K059_9STRA|nr:hypothetical protein Pcac1_g28127 [Phytophthora cactorum]KAG3074382.1 hypothetical protein PI125_g22005 [Phytophthora idaei]KAG2804207.1 hypothetical protein PC112_g18822 [Phytophthora cactorum]KAG2879350.1 hypothetical protein PC114_g22610 [Phytophthora cactorum]KAG2898584.1 hypothetical protein PC117_g22481 [Phytophthora cactorum]